MYQGVVCSEFLQFVERQLQQFLTFQENRATTKER